MSHSSKPPGLVSLPNLLTFSRLIFLPVVIAGIVTRHGAVAAVAMLLLWITDLLDGRIARRLRQASPFGKTLDSTVDFVLIYSLFIVFYAAGRLATYQFGILYLGLLTILLLQFSQMATGSGELAATALGKVTGGIQYLYILFLVAMEVLPASTALELAKTALFAVLAIVIVLNGAECALRARRLAAQAPEQRYG
jgi:phosphatidylglycerophosphate synthase